MIYSDLAVEDDEWTILTCSISHNEIAVFSSKLSCCGYSLEAHSDDGDLLFELSWLKNST